MEVELMIYKPKLGNCNEVNNQIDEQLFEKCIQTVNEMFARAEKLTWKSLFENIIGCFTCYLSHLCMEYQFSRTLRFIADYLREQNETVFIPHGLFITDPAERGLRMIEISILNNVNVTHSPAV